MLFVPLWVTLSYFPLAHMVWGGGFLSGLNENGLAARIFGFDPATGLSNVIPVDYAGGTVVHINAGVAGLRPGAADRHRARDSARTRCARTTCRSR